MSKHQARISWKRNGAEFFDRKYSRGHEWSFDGGITVPASSSPQVIRPPLSVVEAVDPEEALVASVSSCHMLWFLALAAKDGYLVESYEDEAVAEMGKDDRGRIAITRITLRPVVEMTGIELPNEKGLEDLHREAHEKCNIANSLRSEVVVEPKMVPEPVG